MHKEYTSLFTEIPACQTLQKAANHYTPSRGSGAKFGFFFYLLKCEEYF